MTTTEAAPRALAERDRRDWRRHPVDVAHLVLWAALLVLVLVLTALVPSALTNASADLVRLLGRMPDWLRYALVVSAQLLIIAIPICIVGWLLARSTRALTALVVASAVASGVVMVLITDWLTRAAPPTEITDLRSSSFIPTDFPSAAYLAGLVAGATTASPLMSASWRRVAWTGVGVAAAVRILSATQAPVSIAVTVTLGMSVGYAFLVAFGSPQRRPGSATLRAALAAGGFDVDDLADEATAHGTRVYDGTADGKPVQVLYLDRDDRDAEVFAGIIRAIRVRDVDEQSLSTRPRVRVAQLALTTSMAERAGVRVPRVLAAAPADRDSAVYVVSATDGRSLTELDGDTVSEAALDDAWRQLGLLHDAKIAHRSLASNNVVVDGDTVTLTGMGSALLAASSDSRAVDRAELLVASALAVGSDRAVAAAVRNVPHEQLAGTLPFIQLPALSAPARRLIAKRKKFADELRTAVQQQLGVDEVELAELERISFGKAVTWVGFAVLAFILLAFASNWDQIRDALTGIDWPWAVPVLIATLLGTLAGAFSLSGSVVRRVPLGEATLIMFGQSFLNRFTPMNAGGMAIRVRYLQKGGTDGVVAAAAIGLTSAASGVMQALFLVVFLLWSSTDAAADQQSGGDGGGPDLTIVLVIVLAVVLAAIVIALTPKIRHWVIRIVTSTLHKIKSDFGELARMPSKLGLLFGGAAMGKMCTIVAFVASCRAFDVDLSFATLGALYMIANTIASTVPTPGGVGAVGAALVLVLGNAGVDEATAWAAVILFRGINYWFPTIPGYIGLKASQSRGLV